MRRIGLASMLAATALTLSGCWGTVFKYPEPDDVSVPGSTRVVVHEDNTAATIWTCTILNPGDRLGRAECALELIGRQCREQPLPGGEACGYGPTTSDKKWDMADAIDEVLGPARCLTVLYTNYEPYYTADWDGWPYQNGCAA